MDWHILLTLPLLGLTNSWRGVRIGGKVIGGVGGLGASNNPAVRAFDKAKAAGDREAMEKAARQLNEQRLAKSREGRASGPISSSKQFQGQAMQTLEEMATKKNSGLVGIYELRRQMGDRVGRENFDNWMMDMHRSGKITLISGDMPGLNPSIFRDSIRYQPGAPGRPGRVESGDKITITDGAQYYYAQLPTFVPKSGQPSSPPPMDAATRRRTATPKPKAPTRQFKAPTTRAGFERRFDQLDQRRDRLSSMVERLNTKKLNRETGNYDVPQSRLQRMRRLQSEIGAVDKEMGQLSRAYKNFSG